MTFQIQRGGCFLTNSPLYLIVVLLYKILGRNKMPLESIKSEKIHYTANQRHYYNTFLCFRNASGI